MVLLRWPDVDRRLQCFNIPRSERRLSFRRKVVSKQLAGMLTPAGAVDPEIDMALGDLRVVDRSAAPMLTENSSSSVLPECGTGANAECLSLHF